MSSVRCLSRSGISPCFVLRLPFQSCTASAQNTTASDSPSSRRLRQQNPARILLQLADDAGMPDTNALPAAPDPKARRQAGNMTTGLMEAAVAGGIMSHLTYEVGGGFNAPTSDSSPYITWGGNFTVGGGLSLQPDVQRDAGVPVHRRQIAGHIIAEAGATGGHDHIWSLTVDPVVDLIPKSAIDVYVHGGGGFYRKVTSFTDPSRAVLHLLLLRYVTQNVVVGHYSSNQGGWNIGGGIGHRFAGWNGDGKMKIFAEARYLDVMTPAVTTQANGLGTTTVGADTKIIPVTVGLRC